jgi:L-asparaginase II
VPLPVLVEVVRSGVVECTHSGSVVALRADGSPALALGEVDVPVFPRSSNKPLQAVGLLELGWDPDDQQLALATASHNGEPGHLEVVLRALADAGLGEGALGTPPALPLHEPSAHALLASGGRPTPLTMNCSGKHAGMLAVCAARGWDVAAYKEEGHPLQVALRASLERQAGEPVAHVAVDGCGAPQHALTLTGLARAFARIATATDGPEARVARAMRAHPWHVAGTGRDCTELMEAVPGLVAKDGAEGVYAAALPDGRCAAVKIADGGGRARTPVLVAALRALGVEGLERWATTPVLGGGVPVGETRAVAALR